MSFLRLFGVAVCLWYTVIATEHGHLHSPLHTRASADIPDGSFVVDRQRNSNHIRNGAMAKGKIMRKYSKSETAGSYFHDIGQRQMRRLAKRQQGQTGQVQATPEAYYSEYLVPVSIGGQTLMIDMGEWDGISRPGNTLTRTYRHWLRRLLGLQHIPPKRVRCQRPYLIRSD
jgi:hypothetical protein